MTMPQDNINLGLIPQAVNGTLIVLPKEFLSTNNKNTETCIIDEDKVL
jgi:hypothetical protein